MDVMSFLFDKLRYFLKNHIPQLSTKIETLPSDIPDRIVEYPFVFRELNLVRGRIIDVGCTSPYNIIPLVLADRGFDVYGIDVRTFRVKHPNFKFVKGKIEKTNFSSSFFDRVIAVSTIEHIGLRGRYSQTQDLSGDRKAVLEITRILKDDGRLLLTVPFGKTKISGSSHRIYNIVKLLQLLEGLTIVKKEFYFKNKAGFWEPCNENVAESIDESPSQEYALACLVLSKNLR